MPVIDSVNRKGVTGALGKRVTKGPYWLVGPKSGDIKSDFSRLSGIRGKVDQYEITNGAGTEAGSYTITIRPFAERGFPALHRAVGDVAIFRQINGVADPDADVSCLVRKRPYSGSVPLTVGPVDVLAGDRLWVVVENKDASTLKYKIDVTFDLDNQASLDLRFAETKSLVDATTGTVLVDHVRASNNGTYVDSDGLIKRATANLLLRSEEFDNANWGVVRATVSANQATAPNGTLTADALIEDTSATTSHYIASSVTLAASATYCVSCYVKPNGRNHVIIWLAQSGWSADGIVSFDLTGNGSVVFNQLGTAQIQAVGNGWYRCSVTHTSAAVAGTASIRFAPSDDGLPPDLLNYTGNGTSGLYLWGAQLEQSSTVGEYVKTTSTINSAPRFTHDPVTGESLGLLVEEQRVNLLQRTEEFDNAVWNKIRTTITSNAAIAPDGTLTADFVAPSTDNDSHLVSQLVSTAASKTYARSVFAKAAGYSQLTVRIAGSGWASTGSAAYVNLQTGAVTGPNPELLILQRLPNNWFRISSSATTDATTSSNRGILIAITQEDNISFAGDPTKGIYLWGGDMEEGAFATSYTKNVDNPLGATRAADVVSISGSNFSSWYNASEGTMFADSRRAHPVPEGRFSQLFYISDGTGSNSINIGYLIADSSQFRVRNANNNEVNILPLTTNLRRRTAGAYSLDNAAVSENGAAAIVDNSAALPIGLNQVRIGGDHVNELALNGTISRLTYWPQRLPNSTLQAITL